MRSSKTALSELDRATLGRMSRRGKTAQRDVRHQEGPEVPQADRSGSARRCRLHLIADNYAVHQQGDVQTWLVKHQRFYMHFIPTSALWMNLVDASFGISPSTSCGRAVSNRSRNSLVRFWPTWPNGRPIPCAMFGKPRERTSSARFTRVKASAD